MLGKCLLALMIAVSVAVPGYADGILLSFDATFLWDTLRISADPGVTVNFLEIGKQTYLAHSFNANGVGLATAPNWGPLSYNHVSGGLTNSAQATLTSLSSHVEWTDVPLMPTFSLGWLDRMFVERQGNFEVTGSGMVTFAVDYILEAHRVIDLPSLSYPYIRTQGQTNMDVFVLGFGGPGPGSSGHTEVYFDFATGSATDHYTSQGTLSVAVPLTPGTYTFYADSFTDSRMSVPETSSVTLMGFGLIALLALKRRTSD